MFIVQSMNVIYSIGHGHKTIEDFVNELKSFKVEFLIDVRSSPFSRWAPYFNRGVIENELCKYNIRYVYMGDSIGGRPLNDSGYDQDGFFNYKEMANAEVFKNGLLRLKDAYEKKFVVAIMCTESEPSLCHRSKLIGRELYDKFNINMEHIVAPYKTIPETKILSDLTKGSWDPNGGLFGPFEIPYFKSRKAYKNVLVEEMEGFYD
jgi:uncharacterized protein (DUF488 family)